MSDLRMPNIVGDEREQLVQIRSYLYQLIPELNFALSNVNNLGGSGNQVVMSSSQGVAPTGSTGGTNPQATFNSIKALIIKSADIVEAYYDEINKRLEGIYVAESDFGDYAQQTSQTIKENSESVTREFENVQVIINSAKSELNGRIDNTNEGVNKVTTDLEKANQAIGAVSGDLQGYKTEVTNAISKAIGDSETGTNALLEGVRSSLQGSIDDIDVTFLNRLKDGVDVKEQAAVIGVKAYIKTGLLRTTDNGIDEYGIEIGEEVNVNGEAPYKKFARFTSEKLSFFDSNGTEVAYISDRKLYIANAQVTTSFQTGGLIDLIMDNGDVVTKWIGTGG